MESVIRVGKTYKVRKRIPVEARAAFGIAGEFKTVSLKTTDKREAQRLAVDVLSEWDALIAEVRGEVRGVVSAPPLSLKRRVRPDEVFEVIRAWRHSEIDRDYQDYFNAPGGHDRLGEAAATASRLRYRLQHLSTVDEIGHFTAKLADVLGVSADAPFLQRPNVREWFRSAWSDVEAFRDRFAADDFDGWPEEVETPVQAVGGTTQAGIRLSGLRNAWDAVKPLQPRQKGYIRRLIEYLGDVDITGIQPGDMDRFLVELKKFPKSKRPADDRLSFADLIAKYQGADYDRLHIKTVWNWTAVFKAMFAFGVSRRLMEFNPAADMMKKPTGEESNTRYPYSESDLGHIFSRPMYAGFSGGGLVGYRAKPGDNVVRDSKYWLPVVALHTGMRLEELASLRMDELITESDVVAFDLRSRPLSGDRRVKNAGARRVIPLHHRLFDLGFVEWARTHGDDFVFPGLAKKSGKRGPAFGAWWSRWCGKNSAVKGQGIDAPSLTFHSFRHSFKRAARMSPVKEEVHDLITGHTENAVARAYGAGVDIAVLKSAIDQIEFRWPQGA